MSKLLCIWLATETFRNLKRTLDTPFTDFSIKMYLFKTQLIPKRGRDELTICVGYDDLLFLLQDMLDYTVENFNFVCFCQNHMRHKRYIQIHTVSIL